jgi:hypothetical protein
MDEATLRSYRSFRHPLFSVLLPFGFVWLVSWCLRAAIPALGRIPGVYPVLLLVATLSETAVSGYLTSRRAQGILPRLRELLLLLLFSLAFLKLVSGDVFRGDWTVGRLDIVLAMLLVAVEWLFAVVIHAALRERELLLSLVVGKDRGELKESLREMGTEAAASLAGLSRVRQLIVAFQAIAFLAVFFLSIARPQVLTPGLVILAVAHFAIGLALLIAVNGYREWQALMGEGFAESRHLRSRRAGFAAVLCLVAALALIPAVGRDAPLPSSYLQAFIAWLQRITTLPERTATYDEETRDTEAPDYRLEEQSQALRGLGEGGPQNEALQRLLRILILVVVAGGPAIVIVVLLVAPLFRKREQKAHPVRALRDWFARTARALAQGFRNFLAALRYRPRGDVRRKSLRDILFGRADADAARPADERAGFFQRLGLSREIRTFVKVIRWGERRGVPFHRSLGPREYAGALGASVPEVKSDLERLADILEELLFSGRGLPPRRTEEYFDAARLVLRTR